MKNTIRILVLLSLPLVLGCDSHSPLSPLGITDLPSETPNTGDLQQAGKSWDNLLAFYRNQITRIIKEIKGENDFTNLYGGGFDQISGDGTYVGQGKGMASLEGIGVVTGELAGSVYIKNTDDINITGLEFIGEVNDYKKYEGSGFFTATSNIGQNINVQIIGYGWVIGAGTGIVFYSGQGWVFWYH